jgi:hypothetical protein
MKSPHINIFSALAILGVSSGLFACKETENPAEKKSSPAPTATISLIAPISNRLTNPRRIAGFPTGGFVRKSE